MNKSLNTLKKKLKKREAELKTVSHTLMQNKQELTKTKSELGRLSRELVQTNKAISVLAKNIETQKDEMESKVNTTISDKIMPIINALQTEPMIKKFWPQINSIAQHLKSMNNQDKSFHKAIYLLSQTEMKHRHNDKKWNIQQRNFKLAEYFF